MLSYRGCQPCIWPKQEAYGPDPYTVVMHKPFEQPLTRLHSNGLSCCSFCLLYNMKHGGSISSLWEVEKYSQGCLETPQLTTPFFIHFVPSFWGDRVLQSTLWYMWVHPHSLTYIIYTNAKFLVLFYGQICTQYNLNATKCKKLFFFYLILKQNL